MLCTEYVLDRTYSIADKVANKIDSHLVGVPIDSRPNSIPLAAICVLFSAAVMLIVVVENNSAHHAVDTDIRHDVAPDARIGSICACGYGVLAHSTMDSTRRNGRANMLTYSDAIMLCTL